LVEEMRVEKREKRKEKREKRQKTFLDIGFSKQITMQQLP